VREQPGARWVAIADAVEDPVTIASRIREEDPTLGIVILGSGGESLEAMPVSNADADAAAGASAAGSSTRRSERERSLLHDVRAAILLVKHDGSVGEWNREAEMLYGVSREDALGRAFSELLPAEERELISAHLERIAAAGHSPESAEHSVRTSAGLRHLSWSAAPTLDENGEPAVLFNGVDITGLRDAEQKMRETQQRAFAADKITSIAALTAGIAHDIGTPLTTILGYAELLVKSASDEKNRKRAITIIEQVNRVTDLLEMLRNLAQMEDHSAASVALDQALDAYREIINPNASSGERE
jgi:PAS domain S-box-containing protein